MHTHTHTSQTTVSKEIFFVYLLANCVSEQASYTALAFFGRSEWAQTPKPHFQGGSVKTITNRTEGVLKTATPPATLTNNHKPTFLPAVCTDLVTLDLLQGYDGPLVGVVRGRHFFFPASTLLSPCSRAPLQMNKIVGIKVHHLFAMPRLFRSSFSVCDIIARAQKNKTKARAERELKGEL